MLHERLALRARASSDAIALVFEDRHLSYRDLDRRSDQLARYLRTRGIGPETLVAVFTERSLEMVIAVLGILKAGGAYLPLDPRYPRERLAFILEDAAVSQLLTQTSLASALPPHGARTVFLDRWETIGDGEDEEVDLESDVTPLHLAYAIYTSGSTGRPKGVLLTHRGLLNFLRAQEQIFRPDADSQVLQFSPLAFDASLHEILLALNAGGTLHLATQDDLLPGPGLAALLVERRISHLTIPPSALLAMPPAELPALELIACAGEACPESLVERWAESRRFLNAYGPSESTIWTSGARCRRPRAGAAGRPTIGRPIPGLRIHLVDRWLRPVRDGQAGELAISGLGLARGYLRRPGLTAERFVPDPESADPGGRLYRTGDLGRRLADGNLDFLGRIDRQVKLRGQRVELGEIERVLVGHPAVLESVVVVREEAAGDQRLVAYVVVADETPLAGTVEELREEAQKTLPEYMVPAAFVMLDSLPLTPHGKVDHAALPAPEYGSPSAASVEPRNELERLLAQLLAELLGRERVGIEEDFFELGAHSLLIAQLATRIRQTLDLEIAISEIFEAPRIEALAELLQRSGRYSFAIPPIERAPRDRDLPLSFPQERIWFLQQLAPENLAYNVQGTFHFQGPLDADILESSFTEIVRRHEILRTTFPERRGRPVQVIHPPSRVRVPRIDLRRLPEPRRVAEAERWIAALLQATFDVTKLPLVRWTLFRLADDEHTLLHLEHHFVHDGWSVGLLLDELKHFYTARAEGRRDPLPELPVQYADFAVWQRQWLRDEILERQLTYWKSKLEGSPAVLELPTDRPRPKAHGFRGEAFFPVLPDALYRDLRHFGRRHGVSLFMTTLAAFKTLLYRWSGQEDVSIGSGIANRRLRELESLIGMVVNTVVLRSDLSGNPRFNELLVATRQTMLEAQIHQDMPFDHLVAELRIERDLSHNPLYQVMFAFHDAPVPDLEFAGLTARLTYRHNRSAKADLYIVGIPRAEQRLGFSDGGDDEQMQFLWEYNSELFDRTTMARLWRHYSALLAAVVANPQTRLRELPLLAASERHQLLREWNDTATRLDGARLIHQHFEQQVERRPQAVAVVCDRVTWTYRELNERANRLAHLLRALGVGREVGVGIALERSPELVAALVAVLKAGGTYVPLEAGLPARRTADLLARLEVGCLISCRQVMEKLAAFLGELDALRHLVGFDLEPIRRTPTGQRQWGAADLERQPTRDPSSIGRRRDLAYVIFTSGSTGVPKGVAVRHRPVLNLIAWLHRELDIGPADRVLFLASVGFDLSVYDVFGLLAAGGSIRVVREADVRDPERLIQMLLSERITLWDSAPAALQQLVPFLPRVSPESGERAGLRRVLLSGDWIPVGLPDRLRRSFPRARVTALGGATEATVWSNFFPVREVDPHWRSIPYGRPISNARYHVLDPALRPCPIGTAGDLYIAGGCLASGYAREPTLSAERFLPDPWGGEDNGSRLYATGDRARYLADGNLEFLGRLDHQVKIRGFRVELGEIETVLNEHPRVESAVVTLRQGAGGEKSLVAYVVPAEGSTPAWSELQGFLAHRLPEYMLPDAFVALEALPLTANGKLDRAALPEPDRVGRGLEREASAPRTEIEAMLVQIWSETLDAESIGVFDNFFDLGGHSLLATRLVSRLREVLRVDLSLQTIFEKSMVADLAVVVEEALGAESVSSLPPIEKRSHDARLPLSFAQQRLWFLEQLSPGTPVYNTPFELRLAGRLDVDALARSLAEIVRRHEALRTRFPQHAGHPRQEIVGWRELALPLVDLSGLSAEARARQAEALAFREATSPFDLAAGLLIRFLLLRLSSDAHSLVVNVHHIVSDAWSIGVLLRELGALYAAFATGRPSPLPELSVQYADFAAWQREWLPGEVLEEQLAYWRDRLADAPPLLELPIDRHRPAGLSNLGRRIEFTLPAPLLDSLRRSGRQQGATLFMTLLAAFQALLWRLSGEPDVAVGTPIANRRLAELEGLIGFFVNTLVLRADLSRNPSFSELVEQVRETALGAYAHQDLPFEKLVEELDPERDLSHSPLFQVVFALQNAPLQALVLPGLEISLRPLDNGTTKFDLTWVLDETPRGLEASVTYRRDLFDATTVRRLGEAYRTLIAGALAKPETPLAVLPLLDAAGRHQLLVEWAGDHRPYPRHASLDQLFRNRLGCWREAVAADYGESWLSYRELDHRASALAQRLGSATSSGHAETIIALCLEPSLEAVTATLAVLRAGAAYLPLDPDHPRERLAFQLADSGARVLLTSEGRRRSLPDFGGQVLALDALAHESREGPLPESGPTHLGYVMYTSGSTGRPKGVAVPQRAVARLVLGTDYVAFAPGQVMGQISNPAFDAVTFELWGALLHGGRLSGLDRYRLLEPEAMAAALRRQRVDHMFLTAALFRQVAAAEPTAFATMETLLAGGEAVDPEAARRVLAVAPPARLLNGYGPTEGTTFSLWHPIREADTRESVPLGRPLSNSASVVLDARFEPVPIGAAGELLLGGDGLARGYWRRPALTAERFVPDPRTVARAGARLYRSGDLARWLAGGRVEFLGRRDAQVKIRGFRIELGEIEAALAGLPEVAATAVLALERDGDQRLAAFVVPQPGSRAELAGLRQALGRRLPEVMLPAEMYELEALPLTANRKLDRAALRRCAAEAGAETNDTAATGGELTPYEELVTAAYAEVLGRRGVAREDDFFELGGHSLLATQVLSRLHETFGPEVSLREIFEYSTAAELAARLERIRIGPAAGLAPIPGTVQAPTPHREPLTFAQERLWILDRLEPGNAAYNVPAVIDFSGDLRVSALSRALASIVERHEPLRTRFESVAGEARQVIEPAPRDELLPQVDLSGLETACRGEERERLSRRHARRPFELERGPLARFALLRLDAAGRRWRLLVNMHHIISDGVSIEIFYRELLALYDAFSHDQRVPLAPLPIRYSDFARWQRSSTGPDPFGAKIEHWRRTLAGAPAVLELPLDRPRPAVQSFRGRRQARGFDPELASALETLSRAHGVTLYTALLAAFGVFLSRLTGQTDIVIGSPVANRDRTEVEGLIGFFVNTLVLRIKPSRKIAFAELLGRVRETALAAFDHQDVPFERLVETLQPQRDLRYSPLFQVMFSLQKGVRFEARVGNLTGRLAGVDPGTSKFDLSLLMTEGESGLRAVLESNVDLFDATTTDRWIRGFESLLATLAASPRRQLFELSTLGAVERAQLIAWNDTEVRGEASLFHRLVEAQSADRPDAMAAVEGEKQLSFAALEQSAERLACYLDGLEPAAVAEPVVGLYMERSLHLLTAVLGIAKWGGAFLPLPPEHPPRRLGFLLKDARVTVIVTHGGMATALPDHRAELIDLDAEAAATRRGSGARRAGCATPESLAYVIYTSGSTGRPKGTLVSHAGFVNYLRWCLEAYPLGVGYGVPVYTSLGFDLTLTSLLAPLAAGRTATLIASGHAMEALTAALQDARAWSFVKLTPAHLEILAHELAPSELAGTAAALILGGEALRFEQLEAWRAYAPSTRLINEYGPTEAVVGCSVYEISERDPLVGPVPIGRPIRGARLYVLGAALEPLPLGSAGELCSAGRALARGYLGRPGLTAERFVPDPLAETPGRRLYRTGDRARFRADGVLEFLGRLDAQVKIRGFRIELGEIETLLRQHPAVREAVVTVLDDVAGGRGLAAYWIPEGDLEVSPDELHAALRRELPEYMVPAVFISLEKLPLNRNGKVDRQALPAPAASAVVTPLVGFENEIERLLAEATRAVLGIDRIGLDDNFFDLGAHSMSLVRIHEHVAGELSTGLSVIDFFRYPTIRSLAEYLSDQAPLAAPAASSALEASAAVESSQRSEERAAAQTRRRERRRRRRRVRG